MGKINEEEEGGLSSGSLNLNLNLDRYCSI